MTTHNAEKRIIARADVERCFITELFIPAVLRGQGYGTRELQKLEQQLKKAGCKQINVFVGQLSSNDVPASEFYRKNGYLHYYPNLGNWMTQVLGWPKNGVPQGGMMYKFK